MSIDSKVLDWMLNGETGMSSESMAQVLSGRNPQYAAYPHDPSDFRRCLLLLDAVPEFKENMYMMSGMSPVWARLIEKWDEIKSVFFTECNPEDKYHFKSAPKTYDLMKSVIYEN